MADKLSKRRRIRGEKERLRDKRRKVEEEDDENDVEMDDKSLHNSVSVEAVEKFYDEPVMTMPMAGPTSFAEMEELEAAREKQEEIREASWTVQDLVYNIVNHPMLSVEEKSNAIKAVGNDFGARVASIMDSQVRKEKPIELLEVEALIAKDNRSRSVAEMIQNWISKAISDDSKLSDSDFALVDTGGRYYPISDKAHIRKSLADIHKAISSVGEVAERAKKALPYVVSAAKKNGIGSGADRGLVVEKDATGQYRAVMWPSNKFKDLDGDIFSEKSHEEYIAWVNKHMDLAPVFLSWHTPGTAREKPVDFAAYESGFLLMSSPLTEKEAGALFEAQKQSDLGMSHGTLVLERDPADPRVITKYRMVEVSDLPIENAANPFTDFETLTKEANMDKLTYLSQILGSEEKAKEYLGKALAKSEVLEGAGVESKEVAVEATNAEAVAPAVESPKTDDIVAQVLKEIDVEGLQDFLSKAKEAMEKVPVLEQLVKDLGKSKDSELAEMIAPKAERKFLWSRSSQSPETVLKEGEAEDQKLQSSAPGVSEEYWLPGVQPLQLPK